MVLKKGVPRLRLDMHYILAAVAGRGGVGNESVELKVGHLRTLCPLGYLRLDGIGLKVEGHWLANDIGAHCELRLTDVLYRVFDEIEGQNIGFVKPLHKFEVVQVVLGTA